MIDRRELMVGATGLAAATGAPPAWAKDDERRADDGFPMPAPRDALDPVIPAADPNRWRLDAGWLFHLGDIAFPPVLGHAASYLGAKAGGATGAAAVDYDDSDWAEVVLPHDWVAEAPFDPAANLAQGYRRRGVAWYRRALRLDPADRGKALELQFGAIATHATIWVNGVVVAHNWSGYNTIAVDLTPLARFGDDLNSLAVRVDADAMEGWWYEGGGLYRHAWLVKRPAVHMVTDGVHADPRRDARGWTVPVAATLGNVGELAASATLEVELVEPQGLVVARGSVAAPVAPLGRAEARLVLSVADPTPWSVDRPALYTLRCRLIGPDGAADVRHLQLGFRTVAFDADRGLLLNGAPVKIKGVCVHQDHAGVGVAVPDALWTWRLERLKAMGCNAIRCAHNAPAEELLDACDRLGVLVMDENRNFNPSPDYLRQLEWLVRRDRNHPSVILWSVFNEEPMQDSEAGYQMVRRMAAAVRALDDVRPVTAAMNGGLFAPVNVSQAVDVVGFNYQPEDYDRFHAAHPNLPITSSEDTSAFMTRGAFATDRAAHVMASDDTEKADWGLTHRASWKAIAARPFVAGAFVWTGFDYHGEPSPFGWPSASSFFGIMDLCGFPKTAFAIHAAQWIDDAPVLELSPHWTWPGREGRTIKVMALTNAERVGLSLDGRRIGEAVVDRLDPPSWEVPYAPGRLEAVAYRGGREVARRRIETTGPAVALRLTPDRTRMAGSGEDAQPITVDAVDARGRHVPTAGVMVAFEIEGGEIIGLGNGDPNSHEPEKGARRSLFNGLAQVLVRADVGAGPLIVRASARGLRPARRVVARLAAPARPAAAVARPVLRLADWRRSPLSTVRPDPDERLAENDMNTWAPVHPGELAPAGAGGWTAYRTRFTPRARGRQAGGRLELEGVTGRAELWLDGVKLADKANPAPAPMAAAFPPGDGPRVLTLLIQAPPGAVSGLSGGVTARD